MSVVTNVIITFPLDEPGMQRLNKLLQEAKPGNCFNQVDQHCGGTKCFEAEVWLAAFNHMDMNEFAAMVRAAEWDEPQCLRIFVQEQEAEVFSPFNPFLTSP